MAKTYEVKDNKLVEKTPREGFDELVLTKDELLNRKVKLEEELALTEGRLAKCNEVGIKTVAEFQSEGK